MSRSINSIYWRFKKSIVLRKQVEKSNAVLELNKVQEQFSVLYSKSDDELKQMLKKKEKVSHFYSKLLF